ncbi:UNVERIFIED_CONTAM: hypothetical protein GTU68_010894 [Idotea baltica]|nr:hypothetical protein [Idotea baltica]
MHSNSTISFKISDNDPLWTEETPAHDKINETFKFISEKYLHFKSLWHESYLLSLREHSRDLFQSNWENRVKVDDVVLIKSTTKLRPFWQMGRILQLFWGEDNRVRTIKLKRADGQELVYPICHLFPLEISITHPGNSVVSGSSSTLDKSVNSQTARPKRQAAIVASKKMSSTLDD